MSAPADLSRVRPGSRTAVISCNLEPDLAKRLAVLGISPGAEIEVVTGSAGNPFMVDTGLCRLMLDYDTVTRIRVRCGS